MRNIKYIVVHCTATQPEATVEAIKKYWGEVRGWKDPGYHYLIQKNGFIVKLQNEDKITNGVKGHNSESIHVSYIGGIDRKGSPADTRTTAQEETMFEKLMELHNRYPKAQIVGHCDFPGVNKACPSFDVKAWLKSYVPSELRVSTIEEEDELYDAA